MNRKNILINFYYLFLPLIIGGIVGFLTSSYMDYEVLIKPPLSPPSILFPIIWSIIYLLMGISYFILKKNDNTDKIISTIYYLQLFVNALWSIIFFILKWRFIACVWIILLDLLVIYMILLFKKKDKISAYLNIPYLIWALFATYLTIAIFILN